MPEWEHRYFELRADPEKRLLEGTALVYGDVARTRSGEETFEAGAFGNVSGLDLLLNVQHNRQRPLARTDGGGLVLTDSPERLEISATLPATREADDALELVVTRVLRSLSIEFLATREVRQGIRRIIRAAHLGGIGLVDRGAYPQSTVEAREAERIGRRRKLWL